MALVTTDHGRKFIALGDFQADPFDGNVGDLVKLAGAGDPPVDARRRLLAAAHRAAHDGDVFRGAGAGCGYRLIDHEALAGIVGEPVGPGAHHAIFEQGGVVPALAVGSAGAVLIQREAGNAPDRERLAE